MKIRPSAVQFISSGWMEGWMEMISVAFCQFFFGQFKSDAVVPGPPHTKISALLEWPDLTARCFFSPWLNP